MSRHLAIVLLALAFGWLGIGTARAQSCINIGGNDWANCPDAGAAASAVANATDPRHASCNPRDHSLEHRPQSRTVVKFVTYGGDGSTALCGWLYPQRQGVGSASYIAECSSRPPTTGGIARVAPDAEPASCDNGCAVYPGTQSSLGVQLGTGPMFYNMDGWLPSGDVCLPAPEYNGGGNDGQDCVTQGTLTQCMKQDGRHCAKASNGKEFCWAIDEHGIKASGNEATTKAPENVTPKPPSLPPANGGEWVQKAVSQITAAINGQTSTSTVTQYQSSYGTSGQGASGHGADGEGKGGSGSGSGLGGGSGSGSGGGDGDGDGDGPGSPGGQLGDLYTSDGKTVASVFQAFRARVGESPLIDAIGNFFSVQGGGSCPVFSISASTYWEAMSFDGHCSGDFLAALQSIGWVLMAAAALLAAYWALS